MEKFYSKIVNHKKLIISMFAISAIICMVCNKQVKIDYDMNNYLPDGAKSSVSLDVMNEEYGTAIPNARVMVSDMSIAEAKEMKQKLLEIDGVEEVTWLDDAADLDVPLETLDKDTVETYYKDNTALYTVTINEDTRIETVDAIRDLIGDENSMSGTAVNTAIATKTTSKEVSKIILLVIPICLAILMLTSTSWFEPILLLGSIGIAIVLNQGTNLIFGTISFVTNAAGNVLQLAVSMDYSIFHLHRFAEMRKEGYEPKEAMVKALTKSTSSILSSGLTTVIGFAALILMEFKIGPDMGLAMAKGIMLSLITVFTLLPVITLYCYPLIDKTEHKLLIPSFEKFGKVVNKIMIPAVVIFILLVAPSRIGQGSNEFSYGSSEIFGVETQLGSDTKKINDKFGEANNLVIMVPKGDLEKEKKLSDEIKDIPEVTSIISYVDAAGAEVPMDYVDNATLEQLISKNYSRMVISIKADYEGKKTFSIVEKMRALGEKYYGDEYYLAGESVSTYDLKTVVTEDTVKVNAIAIGAVFIVLLLTMKSLTIPVILVMAIETAIWINLSIPYITGSTLFYIGYLIISSVQLGATVDYAILLTSRYMEDRKEHSKHNSIIETMSSVTVSILTSASILAIAGFLLAGISTHGVISQLGKLLGVGTVLSAIIVLFVVPGMLYLCDGIIEKTTYKAEFYKKKSKEDKSNYPKKFSTKINQN